MKRPLTLLPILLLLCFSKGLASTEEQDAAISFSFTAFSLKPGDYSELYYLDRSGAAVRIEFASKRRSRSYEATVSAADYTLRFYNKAPTEAEEAPPIAVGAARIDPDWDEVLLVFRANKAHRGPQLDSAPQPFTVVAANDSPAAFPSDSLKLLNMTGVPIIGTVDDTKFAFIDLAASPAFDIRDDQTAKIVLATKGKDRYRMIYKNEIEIFPRDRAVLILRPPHRKQSIKIGGQLLLD